MKQWTMAILGLLLLALAGCATLQFEGGANTQPPASEFPDAKRPPEVAKPTFRF